MFCTSFPRLIALAVFGCSLLVPAAASAQPERPSHVTGQVVDPQQAPVVRAFVRLVDDDGRTMASAFTDQTGRFAVPAVGCGACRIEVSLTGFQTTSVAAGPGELMVALALAPVRESVVVSATRDETPASQVAASMTIFGADDIERRGSPLVVDLLRAAPGVTVVRTGGLGGQASLFVRGGDSSYNKVLLDGIPLNEPGGTFNFGNLTTNGLVRVELVRGAQSALFGSDAMSSVVQLFTRRGERGGGRPKARFAWEGGSYATTRADADLSGAIGGVDYAVTLSRLESDNDRPNGDFGNTTLSWNAGTALASGWRVRTVGRIEAQRTGVPGAIAFGRADMDAAFERRDTAAGVAVEQQSGPSFTGRAVYAYTRSTQTSTNLVEDPPFTPAFEGRSSPFAFFDFLYDSRNALDRHHLGYQADWRPGSTNGSAARHFVTAAIDYDAERATLSDRLRGSSLPASRDNVGVTGQYQLLTRSLSLVTGLRVEHNESFGTAVVPRVSVAVTLRHGDAAWGRTVLKGNAGRGVKEPTILQSFSQSPFFLGNPDLEPEWATTADIGVEQRLAGDRVKLNAVWFENRFRNQISTRTIDFTTFASQYFNIGRTRARGLELDVDTAPAPGWRVRAGYTLLDSRIVESTSAFSPVFAEGQWAFRRPRHSGFLDVGFTRGRADVNVSGLFVGRRVDSDFAALEPPLLEATAYSTWTATASYRLRRSVELVLRLENLTGSAHMEPLGFPVWGRTAHAGVRVVF